MTERKNRKVRTGVVISDAPDKTVTVEIVNTIRHPRYTKTVQRRKRLSKTKRWRVVEIVERAR